MKTLILIRHADAEAKTTGQADFERPLSRRGEREARVAGEALRGLDPFPALMISSPAARAAATARIAAEAAGLPACAVQFEHAVYSASAPALLHHVVAAFPDDCDCVALVGHNPAISDLAGILAEVPPAAMRTGSVIRLTLEAAAWKQAVRKRGSATPVVV